MNRLTMPPRIRQAFTALGEKIQMLSPIDLVTIMSVLLVYLHSPFVSSDIVAVLCFSAIFFRGLRMWGPFWIGLGVLRFFGQVPKHWPLLDNHQYLVTWWCIGLGLALLTRNKEVAIRVVSRLLIGLCFLFAAAWKIRSPDFLNGDFFTWTYATDRRLRGAAETFLSLPKEAADINGQVTQSVQKAGGGATYFLTTGPRLRLASLITSWMTVLIEGSLAVLYLLPWRYKLAKYGKWVLALFIVTVYPLAPVVGFGMLLLAMSVGENMRSKKWLPFAAIMFALISLVVRIGVYLDYGA